MMETNYTLNEFLAYVMIYAANADFVIHESEEEHIRNVVGETAFISMLDLFESHNDVETLEFIKELKGEHLTDGSKDALLKIVKEVFLVDEEFKASEKALFEALKKL